MNLDDYNRFCRSLPASTHVVQWGGSHVWKVGGKVFAIAGWSDGELGVTFKVSEMSFELLKSLPGLRPAPYLASRGMSWIQHHASPGLPDDGLKDYIRQSHWLVAEGLSRKLGLGATDRPARPRAAKGGGNARNHRRTHDGAD
jgi:predicted DNA-binding protein (MmcQ/YjbR family)